MLVVSTEYRTGSSGGLESVTDFLIDALRVKTDWNVQVASLRMSKTAEESLRLAAPRTWFRRSRVRTTLGPDTTIHYVGCNFAELEAARFFPRRQLTALARSADAVVVVAGTPASAFPFSKVGTPVILQVATMIEWERAALIARSSGATAVYRKLSTRISSWLDSLAVKVPEVILVENHEMYREMISRGASTVELCPPGIDTQRFRPAEVSPAEGYLLSVGRLSDPRKNVLGLVQAYGNARELYGVNRRLVLAGLTPPDAATMKLISDLELSEFIDILSPVPAHELPDLYRGASLFISASTEEGLGLTFLEAMASGVPVITTATDGAKFVLDGSLAGTALALDDQLPSALANEIAQWLADPPRMAAAATAGRARVEDVFDSVLTADKFLEAIVSVTNRQSLDFR